MIKPSQWEKILHIINNGEKFILTTHVNPDGDAIGSEVALAQFLINKNKQVWIINISETANNYKFLDPENKILTYKKQKHAEIISDVDGFFIVDISDWNRLGDLGKMIKQCSTPKICIDHHVTEKAFADIDIICKQASSTGELIHEFLTFINYDINLNIAKALYTCILTDTGSFRFSNTSAVTHQIASQLIKIGIDTKSIYQEVYENNTPNKIALMGRALSNINYEYEGKVAWFKISKQMFKDTNTQKWDTEGFSEIPRTINGVEVSLMFTELDEKKVKISLRSKGKIRINNVAMKFGGGGHYFAAGAVINKSFDEIIPLVLDELLKTVDNYYNLN